ncbi:hypothetical protein CK203_114044 [Vitis vinifera]|uniref:Uncharacterized protein n=1 Tax=Vitis vinifera TaxID=29760 RepID=A0A438FF44_VITVI|nr:hypothetical protein CK203_114044 [Vitis vinifera]
MHDHLLLPSHSLTEPEATLDVLVMNGAIMKVGVATDSSYQGKAQFASRLGIEPCIDGIRALVLLDKFCQLSGGTKPLSYGSSPSARPLSQQFRLGASTMLVGILKLRKAPKTSVAASNLIIGAYMEERVFARSFIVMLELQEHNATRLFTFMLLPKIYPKDGNFTGFFELPVPPLLGRVWDTLIWVLSSSQTQRHSSLFLFLTLGLCGVDFSHKGKAQPNSHPQQWLSSSSPPSSPHSATLLNLIVPNLIELSWPPLFTPPISGLREMEMINKWQERNAKLTKEINSPWAQQEYLKAELKFQF